MKAAEIKNLKVGEAVTYKLEKMYFLGAKKDHENKTKVELSRKKGGPMTARVSPASINPIRHQFSSE